MSTNGKSFTFLSGFAGLVREVAAEDVDEGAAVLEGDRVLSDVEEFLNRYGVTLANDAGDVIFNGDVGIGTTAPLVPLHIEDATSAAIILDDSGGTKGAAIDSRVKFFAGGVQNGSVGYASGVGIMQLLNNDGPIYVQTDSADDILLRTTGTTRMTVDSAGLVGIGGSVANRQLTVQAARTAFELWHDADVGAGSVTGGVVRIGASGDSTNPDTGDYWILFRKGNGTTIGSVRGTGSASVNFSTTSDATLKTDNGPVAEARIGGIIDGLRIHDFDWIEGDVNNQIGVFAQEAIEVLPESIVAPPGEDDDGNYLPASLDYSKIVPILVAECQFLRGRVSALESAASGNRPA